jgi:hypothetical protein
MDKTLADYINRMKALEENKHINEPVSNQYQVIPEPKTIDSDEKINPYSQH